MNKEIRKHHAVFLAELVKEYNEISLRSDDETVGKIEKLIREPSNHIE